MCGHVYVGVELILYTVYWEASLVCCQYTVYKYIVQSGYYALGLGWAETVTYYYAHGLIPIV